MSVHLLENDRLYSKEIGADLHVMTEKPPIQAGKEVLLITWDMEGRPELQIPRPSVERHLQSCGFTLGINEPWTYGYAIASCHDQGVVMDWAKEHHKLEYYLGSAEHILQRVTDYDPELSPLVASDCMNRIDELRMELRNLDLDRRRFLKVDTILIRARQNLGQMVDRWLDFRANYIEKYGSCRVDVLTAERIMRDAEQAVSIHHRTVYLGLVSVGKVRLLVKTAKPCDAVIYAGFEAEVGLKFLAPLTGIISGGQPEDAVAINKTRGTNQDQTMWIRPAPFGIRTTKSFSTAENINIFLADPPSNMYIGNINEAKAS